MKATVSGAVVLAAMSVLVHAQAPAPGGQHRAAADAAAIGAASQRALLDRYCVTCHNDRLKTAQLSLEKLDLAGVGDHPELWEKVVRKLRAGVMPPPDVRRPPLAEYEGLRDWLENAIDRQAPRMNPGAVVLHRLNRTEYTNAVRDLLDLDIDAATLLPPDDSARGFDNIAGSLTISPTLLESYTTAAARVARMAVGYWKTPTEATYLAPGDTSQNQHVEGLPFGTRGGMLVHHDFPADGEYKFSIQNFGIGSYIPGERLELDIDGERAHLFKYQGVGLSQGMSGEGDGSLDVTIPVKAGSRVVGATFLATNYRPSLDMIRQYDRKSLENNSIPQLQYYPAIGFLRIQGPFNAQRPDDSRSRRRVLTCHPAGSGGERTRMRAHHPHDAGAARVSPAGDPAGRRRVDALLRRRPPRGHVRGRHRARAAASARQPAVSRARGEGTVRRTSRPRLQDQRPGTGVAALVLPVEQHPGRPADQPGQPGPPEQSSGAGAAGAPDARRPTLGRTGPQLRPAAALPSQSAGDFTRRRLLSGLGRRAAPGFQARGGALLRQHHPRGSERRRSADGGLHVRQRAPRAALRHPEHLRLAFPPGDAGARARRAARAARQRQLSRRDLDAELPDVAGEAGRVGAGEHPRDASAGAAAERAAARRRDGGLPESADASRADDRAPQESAVRRLPQDHGPDRLRARQFRRGRQVAREAGRRRRHADRRLGDAVRRPVRGRPRGIAAGPSPL